VASPPRHRRQEWSNQTWLGANPGKDSYCPEGHYELRHYEGSKPIYTNVGTNPADARVAQQKQVHLLAAKDSADAAGATIVEEEKRVYLRKVANLFVADAENRNVYEAAKMNRRVSDEFIAIVGRTFADEVTKDDCYKFQTALESKARATGQ